MLAKYVLIISPGDDIHALAVKDRIRQLYGGSVNSYIFDTATYPLASGLSARLDGALSVPVLEIAAPLARNIGPRAGQLLKDRDKELVKTAIPLGPGTSVWLRRYRQSVLHPDVSEAEFRSFCAGSLKETLLGAISTCTVYNCFDYEQAADRKLQQLLAAIQCGLSVPRTLVSSNSDQIEAFTRELNREGKRVIYKHAASIGGFGMPTRIFDDEARARLDAVKYAPSIFQQEILGIDLRIAVVGSRIFCCEWRGLFSGPRLVDIKLADNLKMYSRRLPTGVSVPLLSLQKRLRLDLGIYDFKLDSSGQLHFLEVNPSGQWLDMEIDGGQQISESLARLVVEGPGEDIAPEYKPYLRADLDVLFRGLRGKAPSEWIQVV